MSRSKFVPFFSRSVLLLIFAAVFIALLSASGIAKPSSKQEAIRQKADMNIAVAVEQYERGYYQQSLQTLVELKQTYYDYLTEKQQSRLNNLIEQSDFAVSERKRLSEFLYDSEQLASRGNYAEAVETLEEIQDSRFLTGQEKEIIVNTIADLKAKSRQVRIETVPEDDDVSKALKRMAQEAETKDPGPDETRDAAMELDIEQELFEKEKPKPSPRPVLPELEPLPSETEEMGKEPAPEEDVMEAEKGEDVKIVTDISALKEETAPAEEKAEAKPAQEGKTGGYIRMIRQRKARQISYTRAIVDDAKMKAEQHLVKKEFDQAQQAVAKALSTVNRNKLLLGDELYKEYYSMLTGLDKQISEAQQEHIQTVEQQRIEETEQLRRQIRKKMEEQRTEAVRNYMKRAKQFQAQQRYEEALGQLEQLLAVDPRNNEAIILKTTLGDTVRWRKELEVKKESDKEELDLLLEAQRRTIPYANEINYAKNWKELVAKRKVDQFAGKSPADVAVDKLLDELIDMSMLTEDTTFADAIDMLKRATSKPLPIIVNWKDLSENAFIEQSEPIGMNGEGLTSIRARTALQRILDSVGGGFVELGFVIDDGIITIATKEFLPTNYVQRVYDVTEIIVAPVDFESDIGDLNVGTQGGGGGGRSGGGGGSQGGGSSRSSGGGSSRSSGGSSRSGGGSSRSSGGSSRGGGGRSGGRGGGGGYGSTAIGSETITGSELAEERSEELIDIVINTIEPDSWYESGGEGTISVFGSRQIVVWQTPEIHEKIQDFFNKILALKGDQVAIEARFLLVDENFLEDIGIDITINRLRIGGDIGWLAGPTGGATDEIRFGAYDLISPDATTISSTLGSKDTSFTGDWTTSGTPGLGVGFSVGGMMDDLQADFLVRATQMHSNSKSLTAPKVVVMNGESATMSIEKERAYISDADFQSETATFGSGATDVVTQTGYWDVVSDIISTGVVLNVTPTINKDRKYVTLRISTSLVEELDSDPQTITAVVPGGATQDVNYELPVLEYTTIETRVTVPDRGTVLLGGLTLTAEKESEAGVPMLSKIPLIGRLFSNRAEVRDKQILLILVKPTIILKDEAEREAIAAME